MTSQMIPAIALAISLVGTSSLLGDPGSGARRRSENCIGQTIVYATGSCGYDPNVEAMCNAEIGGNCCVRPTFSCVNTGGDGGYVLHCENVSSCGSE